MTSSGILSLADAVGEEAERSGARSPAVRGADWRTAEVATVDAAGTVTTTDGIPVRRLQSYRRPAVGDIVVITRSGAGSWAALGRLDTGTDGWTALTLPGGWSPQANYYAPAYRLNRDGTASLSGMSVLSGSLATGTVVTTLPSEARPAAQVRFPVQVAVGYFGVMTLLPNGQVQLGDYSGTLPGTGNKWAQFDVATHYRLT
ncbi:hypothetical protein [Streptomyces sp. C10-9-1]|uniref:hypothetical protein n=1 Tax=Streptomyces sp. C10-9-1 TaxID=1859285 RepID=UPI003F4A4538